MTTKRLTFPGASGAALAARLELPAGGDPLAYALFAHCFTCSKDIKAAVSISRELARYGIAVLRFDFTGLGESEGDFADTNFTSNVEDLEAACRFLAAEYGGPHILVGHSLGGAAVLQAAMSLDMVRAVATIGAPYDPEHIAHLFEEVTEEIRRAGVAVVSIGGRRFRVKQQFLDDLAVASRTKAIGGLRCPLLVMHSPVDAVVGIENAAAIYQAAKHPKSFISLDTADHLLSKREDAHYAARVLAAWVSRYVEPASPESRDQPRAGIGVTATVGASGYRTEIAAGRHSLVADEPESVGGTDEGPTPYDLLAAALGACTTMTLRMYADRKGWPLEGVEVGLRHSRVHVDDGEQCEGRPVRMDQLERTLRLDGELDEAQRRRLREIADKCPVHRTLEAGVRVTTRVVEDDGT